MLNKQAKTTQLFNKANSNLKKGVVFNSEDYEIRFYHTT